MIKTFKEIQIYPNQALNAKIILLYATISARYRKKIFPG
jgi:hypothetical protein